MDNMKIYNAVRHVPQEAQKRIGGGRLKGMTDINPMWRIKTLTEQFGACGVGWYYEITDKWLENSMASDEITANVKINLFAKIDGEWSMPIVGVGGSMFVSKEKSGYYTDDECFKKALTDAISVACKALGVGADIYWDKDSTKYSDIKKDTAVEVANIAKDDLNEKITKAQAKTLGELLEQKGKSLGKMQAYYGIKALHEMTKAQYGDCLRLLTGNGSSAKENN